MTDKTAREIDHTLVETVARALAKSAGHVPHRIDMRWRYYADMAKDAIIAILAALDAGGFAVVPKVPTEAILLAMHDGPLGADNEMGPHQRAWLREMYEAALAASNPKEEGK